MDSAVKEFIERNADKISKIALFGTSAMMKSMKKPMAKVIEGKSIDILNREYHVKGEFGPLHKGKPDEADVNGAIEFAKNFVAVVGSVGYLLNVHVNLVFKAVKHYKNTFFADFRRFANKPLTTSVFLHNYVFIVFGSKI